MKPFLITALVTAASPVLAQPASEESRARFRELTACVQKSIPDYDDRISSAEVVAKILVMVCRSTTPQPRSPDPAAVTEALHDAALVSVLQSRVKGRAP